MNQISLREYCPRTPYGLSVQDIIQRVVNHEDSLNEVVTPAPLLKEKKVPREKITVAGAFSFLKELRP